MRVKIVDIRDATLLEAIVSTRSIQRGLSSGFLA